MIGGRSALLAAGGGNPYGNWTGNYSDVSLLLRGGVPVLVPVVDESPTPKTITTFGSAGMSTTTFKYGDSSLVFDGDGDYATIPVNADFEFGTGDFTVEFWIRFDSIPSAVIPIISLGVGAASGSPVLYSAWSIFFSSGAVWLYRFDGAETSYAFNANLSTNVWYHVAFARSGTSLRCFVNGTQVGTTQSASLSYNKVNNDPLQIGLFRSGVGGSTYSYLHGYIDDLRITKGVARYVSNFTPPAAELPANATDDPSYNSVSLLLRNSAPNSTSILVPADESPTPKAITAAGNAGISTTTFKYGDSSLVFDGLGDRLTLDASSAWDFSGGPHTTECWLYLNSLPQSTCRAVMAGPNNAASSMVIISINQSGQVAMGRPLAGSTGLASPILLSTNQWYHIAMVINGSNSAVFVNGVGTFGSITMPTSSATNQLFIGYDTTTSFNSNLNGNIDDLRITKGVARYTKNFLPPPAELPAI